ncbi:MAG TPA: RNA 2'-phosphotransferase [Polyangia bacterium]
MLRARAASRFLSFVLRHRPDAIGVALDRAGWVDVDALLAACRAHGRAISRAELEEIVATSPKRRFTLGDDGRRIRAAQGHSVDVDLGYAPAQPPAQLFHGTVAAKLKAILATGLRRMRRQHVHLSADEETARAVGGRRGRPLLLTVAAGRMHADGHVFYLSANGVWLTEEVPPAYIAVP